MGNRRFFCEGDECDAGVAVPVENLRDERLGGSLGGGHPGFIAAGKMGMGFCTGEDGFVHRGGTVEDNDDVDGLGRRGGWRHRDEPGEQEAREQQG